MTVNYLSMSSASFSSFKRPASTCLKGGTMVELITSLAVSEKYKDHMPLINLCQQDRWTNPIIQWQRTIQKLIAFCKMSTTFKQFDKYREIVLDGKFDTIEDVIEEWLIL
jgi:hypothetical protein